MENCSCERNIMLCLIRKALHPDDEQTVQLDAGCDAEKLEAMIKRQSLVTMVYPVIMRQADDAWRPLKERLRPVYDREIYKGMVQEYEIQSLLDDMEKDGIDCLPMKGWIMRNYYPDPLMRSMGALDVLIRDMDSQKMQKWMEARGYKAVRVQQQFHDEYQKPPCMHVELHHCLIDKACLQPSEIEWMDEITPTFWNSDNSIKKKKHIYQLTDDLLYVHHISHFYKHFTGSGVGIRPMIDAYLFFKRKKASIGLDDR